MISDIDDPWNAIDHGRRPKDILPHLIDAYLENNQPQTAATIKHILTNNIRPRYHRTTIKYHQKPHNQTNHQHHHTYFSTRTTTTALYAYRYIIKPRPTSAPQCYRLKSEAYKAIINANRGLLTHDEAHQSIYEPNPHDHHQPQHKKIPPDHHHNRSPQRTTLLLPPPITTQ